MVDGEPTVLYDPPDLDAVTIGPSPSSSISQFVYGTDDPYRTGFEP